MISAKIDEIHQAVMKNSLLDLKLSGAVFDSKGRGSMIELLLASKASRSLKNKHGVSPEDLANSIGNYDVAKFFTR